MTRNANILVIEDDPSVRELVQGVLESENFTVRVAEDGQRGVRAATDSVPALVILDLKLPDMSGIDVCRRLKESEATRRIPIVFLTAKADESDVVLGLEMGADDYVKKPFRPNELVARVRAALRRSVDKADDKDQVRIKRGNVTIDFSRVELAVDGQVKTLTAAEFRIIGTLLRRPGVVFTRDQLLDAIGHLDTTVTERNIDVHIASLRKKLGADGKSILTVRGIGYKWGED